MLCCRKRKSGTAEEQQRLKPALKDQRTMKEKVDDIQAQVVKDIMEMGDMVHSAALMNEAIQHTWPYATALAMQIMRQQVEPIVNAAIPKALGEFSLDKDNNAIGNDPAVFSNVLLRKERQLGADSQGFENLVFSASVQWNADCSFDFALGSISLRVVKIIFEGDFTMKLVHMISEPPFFKGVRFFLVNIPTVSFDLAKGDLGGGRSALIKSFVQTGMVKRTIMSVALNIVGDMLVLPHVMGIVLQPGADFFEITSPFPEGLLRLSVWKAENLKAADVNLLSKAKSDPYVKVGLGSQTFSSSVLKKTLNPEFNYHIPFVIYSHQQQDLTIEIFDKDTGIGSSDDFLGRVKVPVKDLMNGGAQELELLDEDGLAGENGIVHISAVWAPLHQDMSRVRLHSMCLLTVGVYSANHILCSAGTKAWVEVKCSNVISGWRNMRSTDRKGDKRSAAEADEYGKSVRHKVDILRKHGMPESDICDVLELDPAQLKSFEKGAKNPSGWSLRDFEWNSGFDFVLESGDNAAVVFELKARGTVCLPTEVGRRTNKTEEKTLSLGKHKVKLKKFASNPLLNYVETVTLPKYEQLKVRMQLRFFDTPSGSTAEDWVALMKRCGHSDSMQNTEVDGELEAFLNDDVGEHSGSSALKSPGASIASPKAHKKKATIKLN